MMATLKLSPLPRVLRLATLLEDEALFSPGVGGTSLRLSHEVYV